MATPIITNRLVRMIGVNVSFCPGEWDCERFQSAAEPKDDACISCEKKSTKPITISPVTSDDEREAFALVDHVADLRNTQRAGLLDARNLNALEAELLKVWHQTEEELIRAQSMQMPRMF